MPWRFSSAVNILAICKGEKLKQKVADKFPAGSIQLLINRKPNERILIDHHEVDLLACRYLQELEPTDLYCVQQKCVHVIASSTYSLPFYSKKFLQHYVVSYSRNNKLKVPLPTDRTTSNYWASSQLHCAQLSFEYFSIYSSSGRKTFLLFNFFVPYNLWCTTYKDSNIRIIESDLCTCPEKIWTGSCSKRKFMLQLGIRKNRLP